MHIGGAAQGKAYHARADRVIGRLVNQDETAQQPVVLIGGKGHLSVNRQGNKADFVQLQRARGKLFQRIDIDLIFRRVDNRRTGLCPHFHQIGAPRQHGVFGHP